MCDVVAIVSEKWAVTWFAKQESLLCLGTVWGRFVPNGCYV